MAALGQHISEGGTALAWHCVVAHVTMIVACQGPGGSWNIGLSTQFGGCEDSSLGVGAAGTCCKMGSLEVARGRCCWCEANQWWLGRGVVTSKCGMVVPAGWSAFAGCGPHRDAASPLVLHSVMASLSRGRIDEWIAVTEVH